jgi:hypothetical protein
MNFGLDKGCVDPFSPNYKLSSVICDVASFRLSKPVRSEPLHDNNRKFLHIPFANKGIDAINISNILNRKEVVKEISPYFKNQSVPIVSYSYTNSIGCKIFNYKEALQEINIKETIRAVSICTFSKRFELNWPQLNQTSGAYSKIGLINVKYIFSR